MRRSRASPTDEELDAEEGMLWGSVYRLPEHESEFVVWVQERSDVPDEFVEDAHRRSRRARPRPSAPVVHRRRDAAEPAAGARRLPDPAPRRRRRSSVPGLVAVYDDNALVVRAGKQVRSSRGSSIPPRPATLYAIHEMEGKAGMWLHTHGLTRLGIPEIELLGLNPSDVQEGYDLIDARRRRDLRRRRARPRRRRSRSARTWRSG